MISKISEKARWLNSAVAVRAKADEAFALAAADEFADWRLDLEALPACAGFVAGIVRERYPGLDAPFHARWRHFVFGGADLWAEARAQWADPQDVARHAFDLAMISVLLDAGAGAAWRYQDTHRALHIGRSEGLALASFHFMASGVLAVTGAPFRADAAHLAALDAAILGEAFQVTPDNPLPGLETRADLLRRLGAQMQARPDLFACDGALRPAGLYDVLRARAANGALPAPAILELLLEALGPIWAGRPSLDGAPLGDCWLHPQLGLTPLHKLSQWLAYSLIEPLEHAGVGVAEIDGLTGLAEYRNGGLFIDAGVLIPRDTGSLARVYEPGDALVIGWRALTVALLDRIAPLVRAELGVSAQDFPLARVLEGGTWAAGRRMAMARRDGAPPLTINSDGTVF